MNRFQVQPSPQSRNARKPLVNLTAHYQNCSEQIHKSLEKSHCNKVCRSGSTQNIKPRISTGESNKVNQLRQRKNSLIANQATTKPNIILHQKPEQKKCMNHNFRHGSHEITDKPGQVYCFECAFVLARQNIKISKIKDVTPMTQSGEFSKKRECELTKYLNRCSEITDKLLLWEKQQNAQAEQIDQEYKGKIDEEISHMEIELSKIKQIYTQHITSLEKRRQARIEQVKTGQAEMHKLIGKLKNSKIDIEASFDGIRNRLSENEFQLVMSEYWKIIDKADVFIKKEVEKQYKTDQFCIEKEITDSNMRNTCQVLLNEGKSSEKKLKKSKQEGKDFTFSKNRHLQTPQLYKTLKGIRYADSIGQTDPYSSTIKSSASVVDSKFTFE